MKRIVVDLDGTLTVDDSDKDYSKRLPNTPLVEKLREYKSNGFEIVIFSARNMRTYNCSVGKINAVTLPVIVDWLKKHDVPYDEIHVGKPWCGTQGFYVDDRAIRPSEFLDMSFEQIAETLGFSSSDSHS